MPKNRIAHLQMSSDSKSKRLDRLGGTDAKIIMSGNQDAIEELWRIKRGEQQEDNLDDILLVQLGNVTEALNLHWFEKNTGLIVTDEQKVCIDPIWPIAQCTLDGFVRETEDGDPIGLMDAKYMFPYHWTIEKAVEKYSTQLQSNMAVTGLKRSWLSVIVGDGRWEMAEIEADEFYQAEMRIAMEDFWDCVLTGRYPGCPEVEAPKAKAVRIEDMSKSNSWINYAGLMKESLFHAECYSLAEKGIKKMFEEDMLQAQGGGVMLKRAKNGSVRLSIEDEKDIKAKAKERVG